LNINKKISQTKPEFFEENSKFVHSPKLNINLKEAKSIKFNSVKKE
jgi:hypothetical protein